MTAAQILSSTATIHAARAYSPAGLTVAELFDRHNERKAALGLTLAALIDGDRSLRLPSFAAGPYSDRYRHELQFIAHVFRDDLVAEWLYRNVESEEKISNSFKEEQ